jgi:hypothetical protein
LIGIPHIEEHGFIEVFDVNPGLQPLAGVAVRAVGGGYQADIMSGYQFLNDVASAIVEITGMVSIAGSSRKSVSPDKQITTKARMQNIVEIRWPRSKRGLACRC